MIRKPSGGDAVDLKWFKSSYSDGTEGDSCVEVALDWSKSSYSSGNDGESCVEIATTPSAIHIRDSKHLSGPRLALDPAAWTDFLHTLT
ncbi:DUF397 domain-containing protein [Streptomyces sp. NPDC002888]|uniref:DUF397 domain-containing protein n=1 Tax=Streptomyces sp. NPDC002888 TaxID=3364668 RepID=UPI003673A4EB